MQKILTKHPDGKKGVNISKTKYEIIRNTIIERLKNDELSYSSLVDSVKDTIGDTFEG